MKILLLIQKAYAKWAYSGFRSGFICKTKMKKIAKLQNETDGQKITKDM